jgi:AcrR family transcriptional regulator
MRPKATGQALVPTLRVRQRQETRARLFEAAMIEFRRAGVAGAQVEDIVRRAGVARGTFYLHFPTKDHVLLDLARTHQASLARKMSEVMDETPERFLARLVESLCEVVEEEGCALSRDVFAAALRHGGSLRSEGIALLDVTVRYFSQAQERAQVRSDRSAADLAALALTGVLAPLLVYDAASPDGLRATLALSADAFVNGIRA